MLYDQKRLWRCVRLLYRAEGLSLNNCAGGMWWCRPQSSNSCELILSTHEEYRSNGRSILGMQLNGGSSNLACSECVLGADWPGSVQSFVSQCKPVRWGGKGGPFGGKAAI